MTDCIFCNIISGQIPSEIVFESDAVIAFRDINPNAKVHILIIPKEHIEPMEDITMKEATVFGDILMAAKKIAESEGIDKSGFRLVMNAGSDSGQEVAHLHVHLLGGQKLTRLS